MTAQVATLREGLETLGALEGSLPGMLPEVVPQVAALLEHARASGVLALKEELDSLGFGVAHTDCLMPLLRNALEGLRVARLDLGDDVRTFLIIRTKSVDVVRVIRSTECFVVIWRPQSHAFVINATFRDAWLLDGFGSI